MASVNDLSCDVSRISIPGNSKGDFAKDDPSGFFSAVSSIDNGSSSSRCSVPGISLGGFPLDVNARGILASSCSSPRSFKEGIGLDEDAAASSSIPILSPGSRLLLDSVLDHELNEKGIYSDCCIQPKPALGVRPSGDACSLDSRLPKANLQLKGCSLPPQKSLKKPISSSYPVLSVSSSESAGSLSALDDVSLVPVVPGSSCLKATPNFEFDTSNFPPLQPSAKASVYPLCAAIPKVIPKVIPKAIPNVIPGPSCEADVDKCKIPTDWASLVKETPDFMQLKFIKPMSSANEGKVTIKLPSSVAQKGASIWKNTMVGFFLDKLPFSLVQAVAMRHWGKLGLQNVLSNGNGYFFFKFSDSGNLNEALEGGPWHFGGRPIFIKRWSPCMNLSKEGCKKVPIWAHFHNVPLEYWTEEGLSYIASMVGKPLHADKMTSSLRRLSYARICIEIDIDDSLPDAFDIELEDGTVAGIQIVYNWIPKRCSVCKEFGHLSNNCKKAGHQVWIPKPSIPISNPLSDGDWKSVETHRRKEPGKTSPSFKAKHVSPSKAQAVPSQQAFPMCGLHPANSFDALRPEAVLPDKVLHAESAAEVGIASIIDADDSMIAARESLVFSAGPSRVGTHVDSPASLLSEGFPIAVESSPVSASVPPSSPTSSSSTPLLARKLIMVDEVERKLGRKKKDKRMPGSSASSSGKLPTNSK